MSQITKQDLPDVLKKPSAEPVPKIRLSKPWKRTVLISAVILGIFGLFFPVENVVVASGRVIPSDRVKGVQHLEGGIVRQVFVSEGERVQQGQPMVEIDLGSSGVNLEELEVRSNSLQASKVRLLIESQGRPLRRQDFAAITPASVIDAEFGAFQARDQEQKSVMTGSLSVIESSKGRFASQQTKIDGLERRLELFIKELSISEQLAAEQLIGQLQLLEARRQVEQVRSELAVARQDLLTAKSDILASQAKSEEAQGRFQRRATEELADTERKLASLYEDLNRARSQKARAMVPAPATGIVKGLRTASAGWVIKPGEQFMEIVPDEGSILIEAQLNPSDRGFIALGQAAHVKVSAYDFLRYGTVEGQVKLVGADADRDPANPQSQPFYRVLVAIDSTYVGQRSNKITAGMEAEVDLVVGHEPFIWYLLRPVVRVQKEAFREP